MLSLRVLDSCICYFEVFFVHLNAYEVKPFGHRTHTCCTATHERVKNNTVWRCDEATQVAHKSNRLHGGVDVLHNWGILFALLKPLLNAHLSPNTAGVMVGLLVFKRFKSGVALGFARFSAVKESRLFFGEQARNFVRAIVNEISGEATCWCFLGFFGFCVATTVRISAVVFGS